MGNSVGKLVGVGGKEKVGFVNVGNEGFVKVGFAASLSSSLVGNSVGKDKTGGVGLLPCGKEKVGCVGFSVGRENGGGVGRPDTLKEKCGIV